VRKQISRYKTGDITKFTIVIWLEGDDPDCVDSIIGGQFKVDMSINFSTLMFRMPDDYQTAPAAVI
jgi:hypothetical protein